jgi:hypothetical protein
MHRCDRMIVTPSAPDTRSELGESYHTYARFDLTVVDMIHVKPITNYVNSEAMNGIANNEDVGESY